MHTFQYFLIMDDIVECWLVWKLLLMVEIKVWHALPEWAFMLDLLECDNCVICG